MARTLCNHRSLAGLPMGTPMVMMKLPHSVLKSILAGGLVFCVPRRYAEFACIEVESVPRAPHIEPDPHPWINLEGWYGRGLGYLDFVNRKHWTPTFLIRCAMLAFKLQSLDDLKYVCQMAALICFPNEDVSQMDFPNFESIRLYVIKLDLLHSLSRRRIYVGNCRLAAFMSADSSPQGNYDFLALTEELMKRSCVALPDPFDPFAGFQYERRSKPMTTIARKQGTVAGKLFNMIHSTTIECGTDNLRRARDIVKGYCRDQGAGERGVAKAPVGDSIEIRNKLAGVKAGHLSFAEVSSATAFWPNAFEHSDMCHILQNAIQECLTAEPDWKIYEPLMKAACKILGDKSYKEIVLHECFGGADPASRHRVHRFSAEHVDWRWEYLEDASEQISDVWEDFRSKFRAQYFTDNATLTRKVLEGINLEWFPLFTEFVRVFTRSVGSEMRKCEGCYCHEQIKVDEPTAAKRRRAMLEGIII